MQDQDNKHADATTGQDCDIWQQYWKEVRSICAHYLGPGPNSADMASDIMMAFVDKYAHQLRHPEATRSYLRLMAVRRSLRFKQKQSKMHEFDDEQQLASNPGPSVERLAQLGVMRPKLEECLGQLSPKAQQAIRLRFTHDMAYEKIGALLGGSKQYIGMLIN